MNVSKRGSEKTRAKNVPSRMLEYQFWAILLFFCIPILYGNVVVRGVKWILPIYIWLNIMSHFRPEMSLLKMVKYRQTWKKWKIMIESCWVVIVFFELFGCMSAHWSRIDLTQCHRLQFCRYFIILVHIVDSIRLIQTVDDASMRDLLNLQYATNKGTVCSRRW